MAMISVWYPKENGPGIDVKEAAKTIRNKNQFYNYLEPRLNVGHASLLLDRLPTPTYISWWPQSPATKTPTYRFDVQEEGGNPNVMISIDTLDEEKIDKWWRNLVSSREGDRGGYKLTDNNCSTIVANALSAGGAEQLSPMPKYSMWTPARIEEWASKLLDKSGAKTNGIFRHEGIGNFIDAATRRMVSELGAAVL